MKEYYFTSQSIVDGLFRPLSSYSGTRSDANRIFRNLCSSIGLHNTTIRVCAYRDLDHYLTDEDHPVRVTYLNVK